MSDIYNQIRSKYTLKKQLKFVFYLIAILNNRSFLTIVGFKC